MRLTREAFATKLSISPSHLYNLEHGTRNPSRDLLRQISIELGVDFQTLLKRLDEPEKIDNEYIQLANPNEPDYLVAFSNDPNISAEAKEIIAGIIRDQYAKARRNAEDLEKIPEGKNRPQKSE